MQILQDIVTAVRNLRCDMALDHKLQLAGALYSTGAAAAVARAQREAVERLANVKLEVFEEAPPAAAGALRSTTGFDLVLEVPAAQTEIQRKRLEKEIEQLEKVIANSRRQLADETFLARAPETVVNSIRQKLAGYEDQLEKSRSALAALTR